MLPTLIRRAAQKTPTPASAAYVAKIRALYPPKKVWPPDFTKLSPQEQLRYEKKYKRRMALATARPRWDRFIKLTQLFSIVSVLIYAVLFMDFKESQQPFGGLRETFWNAFGYEYDHSSQKPMRRKSQEYSSQSR